MNSPHFASCVRATCLNLTALLQERDRYTVLGESALSGAEVLQSYPAYFKPITIAGKRKFQITYPKRKGAKQYKKELEDNLDRIFKDWSHYVNIFTESP